MSEGNPRVRRTGRPLWAWAAVLLFASAVAFIALIAAVLGSRLVFEISGDPGGEVLGFLVGPIIFLSAGWVWWWAFRAGWQWVEARALRPNRSVHDE